ncbi:Transcription factor bHLH30 [Quillaja saponaria]|uniref:Transcription factor bHLH30 n=1 Tax=Quillaja saponaria TaxID=32244 RepID=A0AAD7QHN8_QUISA|nr:Transcription factor bHLH30 [Quillaja saponaria]
MEAFSWISDNHGCASESETLNGFLLNSAVLGNGFASSSSLLLDSERGELVEAAVKLQRKGVSTERTTAALKNHSEAERRRRARINANLDTLRTVIPGAKKMDKASLLAEVIKHLKDLKRNAAQACEDFVIPKDTDEIRVEQQEDGLDGVPYSIRASLCCEYKPGLMSYIRQALDTLHLIIMRAEIATLGGRMKNIFVITRYKEENIEDTEARQFLASSVHQVLRSVVDRFSTLQDVSLGTGLSNKRQRISIFSSSPSSLEDNCGNLCLVISWWLQTVSESH